MIILFKTVFGGYEHKFTSPKHPYTLASRSKSTCKPKLAKEYGCPNADRKENKKHGHTTLAIRNAGVSADMKVITLNKLFGKPTVKCLEIPHNA